MTDTIAAIATPTGRGGIGVIRVSGNKVTSIAQQVLKKMPVARQAHFAHFFAADGIIIDSGLALYFPAPNSFTGEDVLELQGHAGAIIMDLLLQRVLQCGARLARPGEFSERAFLNDKIDLTQAEAIADLIDAASVQAARSAMRSLQGEFSQKIKTLVVALIELRTHVEAAIDFPDEEIDFLSDGKVTEKLRTLTLQLEQVLQTAKQGALLRDGMSVVIAGKPNAGKSSLLNILSGREHAIVTDVAGTTRDILCEQIQINGLPLQIIDTAGLRDSDDIIEQEGIRRAWQQIEQADVILLVVDSNDNTNDFAKQWQQLKALNKTLIVIYNKIDLLIEPTTLHNSLCADNYVQISAKNGVGIDELKSELKRCIGYNDNGETNFIARRRHLQALQCAQQHLFAAERQLSHYQASELLAEDLLQAQNALNEITGDFNSDDLLGKIFSSFCIGK